MLSIASSLRHEMSPVSLYEMRFPNGKRYIGISVNPRHRLRQHRHLAKTGSRFFVHRAIRKYGEEKVKFRVLCIGGLEFISELEVRAIRHMKTNDRRFGYNQTAGGEGVELTIEARAILSAKVRRAWASPELREAQSKRFRGRTITPEQRARISASLKGHPGYGKGQKRSPEVCAKISASKIGHTVSVETRAKLSAAFRGVPRKRRSHPHA